MYDGRAAAEKVASESRFFFSLSLSQEPLLARHHRPPSDPFMFDFKHKIYIQLAWHSGKKKKKKKKKKEKG